MHEVLSHFRTLYKIEQIGKTFDLLHKHSCHSAYIGACQQRVKLFVKCFQVCLGCHWVNTSMPVVVAGFLFPER